MTPFYVNTKLQKDVPVPCGKCPACKMRRASAWSFRLMYEERRSESAHFITLTYDTDFVPITKNGFMSLAKRDLQLFFKRLRSAQKHSSIKYYAVGEYGGKTMRPHYHIILFNAAIQKIQCAWTEGIIHYGSVTGASIGYTLKYISKKGKIPLHRNDDRVPEFSLMSKNLGDNYVGDYMRVMCGREVIHNGEECIEIKIRRLMVKPSAMVKWHHDKLTDRMYCNIEGGKKITMPRYYKEKIYSDIDRTKIGMVQKRLSEEKVQKLRDELGEDYDRSIAMKTMEEFKKMYKRADTGRDKV